MSKQPSTSPEFIAAAIAGRFHDIADLLEKGVDINSVDFNTGNSGKNEKCSILKFGLGLHYAVQNDNDELAMFLFDRGIDVNIRNRKGQTPLHIAVEMRYEFFPSIFLNTVCRMDSLTKWLVEKGKADYDIKDNMGKTPVQIAALTPAFMKV